MRIMIKGGVWKNTEDEILKAAVMKYGKNQWARISSLLVRKSAKQCKARWYEWLDPSIKKTEWTREEDEKLLHLAKLMPTQWRTIAPIVGRTPSQCLERYEKLLDAACAKDENYEPGDDPRKLRPGEIDPNPESKPARPDPVDMDEDEKEMLSEARARRELKAAGIDIRQRKRKRRGIDYNAEIPFEKKPPPGFYDVTEEDRPTELVKFPTTIEELEGERRVDREARLRKQDIARNKIAQRQDAPSAILQANKLNDPEAVRKRSRLNLPAPQIPDHELEAIAKIGIASDLVGNEELTEGNAATRALLASYAQTPRQGMTPMRTPQRTPAGKQDAIMMEAENQRRLTQSQTPLLGGDNPMLHPSDFSGVTPKKMDIATPNPLLTPSATPGGAGLTPRIGMTPSRDVYSLGMTPKATPMRDELRINEDIDMHGGGKSNLRKELRSGLKNLPQPKNEYQIVIQPFPEDDEEPEEKVEEDMSDKIAREKAEEEARQQALLKKRSKNSLMRADEDKSSFVPPTLVEQADELIRKELLSLLEHDNVKYPLDEKATKEKKKGGKRAANGKSLSVPSIDDFEEDTLKEADELIKNEAQFLRVAMGHENEALDGYLEAHKTCLNDIMYFPTRDGYGLSNASWKTLDTNRGNLQADGHCWNRTRVFRALQKQERVSATYRISNLWEEVQKQKEVEHILQKKYGDLLSELERLQHLINAYRLQAQREEEIIAAKNDNHGLAVDEAAVEQSQETLKEEVAEKDENAPVPVEAEAEAAVDDQSVAPDLGTTEPVGVTDMEVVNTDETRSEQLDIAAQLKSEERGMDEDGAQENATAGDALPISESAGEE
ncbi:hypothetical protein DH2020_042341 [Rehmannia glutinosa]|uniref:Cell division cycle 5-like protein n=1 Tax=Rehmannia glutinosa TaxID=99300 RepID=A0ABR0UNJ4_REHGL